MELLEQLVLLKAVNATMLVVFVVSFIGTFLLLLLIMVVLIGFTLVVFLRERKTVSCLAKQRYNFKKGKLIKVRNIPKTKQTQEK